MTWYTSLAGSSYKAVVKAFESKWRQRRGVSGLRFGHDGAHDGGGQGEWRPDHGVAVEKYEKDLERWQKLMKEISHRAM